MTAVLATHMIAADYTTLKSRALPMTQAAEKKLAVITGGGRGIGAAISRQAAACGYHVIVNYRSNEDNADAVVSHIKSNGGTAHAVQADISLASDVERLFSICDDQPYPLALLVNNAGITGGFARVDELSPTSLRDVFSVNVFGAFLCAKQAVLRMRVQNSEGGVIINISSRAAVLGGGGEWVHYAASKGALDTMTIGLAQEVAGDKIRVNGVAVGFVDTELHAAAGAPDRAEALAASLPMKRVGTAEEVAQAVMWLASADAQYTTGAILSVSGGR